MKKMAIMTVLASALVATSAMAMDIGARYTTSGNTLADSTGITVGQKFGKIGAELAFDRFATGNKFDSYSAVASYDVAHVVGATVAAKAGATYVQPAVGEDGYAVVVGAGASYPITKSISAVVDYKYQRGQDRVKSFDGNTVSVGAKFSF
jgi:outer membrane autotransporter protein